MKKISDQNNQKMGKEESKYHLFYIIYENGKELYIRDAKTQKKYTPSSFLKEYFNLCKNCKKVILNINNNEGEDLCSDCLKNNKYNNEDVLSSTCSIHNKKYIYYCENCENQLCELCNNIHSSQNHEIVKFSNLIKNNNNFFQKIEKIENIVKNFEDILQDILNNIENEINKFKSITTKRRKEFKDIIEISKKFYSVFKRKKEKNDLSYEIIKNIITFTNFININFTFKTQYNYFEKIGLFYNFITENNIIYQTENKIYNKKISRRKNILTLKNHTEPVQCLLILKDGRLASSGNDGLINIYKLNFELDLILNIHKKEVYNIIQNHYNDIVSCSADKTINIIQLFKNSFLVKQTLKSHTNSIIHIREFSNHNLFSCSTDLSIKIWNNTKKGYQLILTLKTKEKIYSILELKKYNQFVCLESEKNINFFDSNNFTEIYSLKEMNVSGWTNSICLLNDNILAIGGKNKIIICNISKFEILHILDRECQVICIKKFSQNLILSGDVLGQIYQWELIDDNLHFIDKINNAHQNKIPSIVQFENGILVTCSNDNTIKIWK